MRSTLLSALAATIFGGAVLLAPLSPVQADGQHGDHSAHGTTDPKIVKCHEEHAKLVAAGKGAESAHMEHMKGCHDKDGKLIGNADGHMGHMDHSGHQ